MLFARTRANFGQELGEVWVIESDAAPAILLVAMHFGIRASLFRTDPNLILRAFALAVKAVVLSGDFTMEAAAALGMAALQVARRHIAALSAAVADAAPTGLPSIVRLLDNEPSPEPPPGQVYRSAHQLIASELVTGRVL